MGKEKKDLIIYRRSTTASGDMDPSTENVPVDDNYYALIIAIRELTEELRRTK